jgi:hypothetical protein
MFRLIFICYLFSQSVNAGWEFKKYIQGNEIMSDDMLMPMVYSHSICKFDFHYFNGNNLESSTINIPSCGQAFVVLDGYKYSLPTSFQIFFDETTWSIYDIVQMGTCYRASGGSIPTAWPFLKLGLNSFKLDINKTNYIKNINGDLYLFYTSFHGDVRCQNGTQYLTDGDLIFKGGFE